MSNHAYAAPNKALGQHWLYDVVALESICDDADVQQDDNVLEVGPGLGTLTSRLLLRGARVVAVEFDRSLAGSLESRVADSMRLNNSAGGVPAGSLQVVESDIMQFNLEDLVGDYKVVANIPYYLTSKLVRVLCESKNPFSVAALLVQKEVAERICASPGQMSQLSVATQYYCQTSLGTFIPSALFTPPPKVDSQVVILRRRSDGLFPGLEPSQFFRVVRAGFSQKRKTLENSLSGGLRISKNEAKTILQTANIDPGCRAQSLDLNNWADLATSYGNFLNGQVTPTSSN